MTNTLVKTSRKLWSMCLRQSPRNASHTHTEWWHLGALDHCVKWETYCQLLWGSCCLSCEQSWLAVACGMSQCCQNSSHDCRPCKVQFVLGPIVSEYQMDFSSKKAVLRTLLAGHLIPLCRMLLYAAIFSIVLKSQDWPIPCASGQLL